MHKEDNSILYAIIVIIIPFIFIFLYELLLKPGQGYFRKKQV